MAVQDGRIRPRGQRRHWHIVPKGRRVRAFRSAISQGVGTRRATVRRRGSPGMIAEKGAIIRFFSPNLGEPVFFLPFALQKSAVVHAPQAREERQKKAESGVPPKGRKNRRRWVGIADEDRHTFGPPTGHPQDGRSAGVSPHDADTQPSHTGRILAWFSGEGLGVDIQGGSWRG